MRGKLKINHNHTFSLSPISSSVLFSTILFPLYKKNICILVGEHVLAEIVAPKKIEEL